MEHTEGFVTAVMEAVASGIVNAGHEKYPEQVPSWDDHDVIQRQNLKQSLLDVVLRTLDAAKEIRGPVDVSTSWPLLDEEVAEALVAASFDSDGRSEWRWLRTADGDLMLGICPQGDTFEMLDQGPAANDFDAALKAEGDAGVSYHTITLED